MKRITDYTQIELFRMDASKVDEIVEIEAMALGISKPSNDPPVLDTVPTKARPGRGRNLVAIAFSTAYGSPDVAPVAFDANDPGSVDAVDKIIAMIQDWSVGGYEHTTMYSRSCYSPEKPVNAYRIACRGFTNAEAKEWDSDRVRREKNKAEHDADLAKWNELTNRYKDVVDSVWNTVYEARSECKEAIQIYSVYQRFVELADGNEDTAMQFLRERFDTERIDRAFKNSFDELTAGADGQSDSTPVIVDEDMSEI